MKFRFAVCLLVPAIVLGVICYFVFNLNSEEFRAFFSGNLRAPLFTGFLGFGGFLFSLKTFIVIKMKENVYDDDYYIANYEKHKRLNPKLTLYAPLKRLSDLLFYTVVGALLTSTMQFTIGFIPSPIASIICTWVALATLLLVLTSLWEIKKNLNRWFETLENGNNKKPH